MFILKASQVDYCVLSSQVADMELEVPGLEYQRKLFVRGTSYGLEHRQQAMEAARNSLLQQKGQATLIVEEGESLTLWHHDKSARKVASLFSIDLKQLVAAMRNIGGVPIKERQFHLKRYSQCFIGQEAVDWLVSYLKVSRQDAVRIGQRLMDENWIHHVVDEQVFQDEYFFYRFRWDEQ